MPSDVNIKEIFQMLDTYAGLNEDQRCLVKRIIETINDDENILHLFIGGESGTGKSFLVRILKSWAKYFSDKKVAVAAPSWISASCIGGVTINRLFRIPSNFNEDSPEMKYEPLPKKTLENLRYEFRDVVLFIIDDISMVSNRMLAYIHLRLTQIFGTGKIDNGYFGRRNVLLIGDLLLGKRKNQTWPFEMTDPDTQMLIDPRKSAVNLWNLFTYAELTQNMRHSNDGKFRDLLSRIRIGQFSAEDAKDILSGNEVISARDAREVKILLSPSDVQIFTFDKVRPMIRFNHTIKAKDEIVCSFNFSRCDKLPLLHNDNLDLQETITLGVSAVVLLIRDTENVDAGSLGVVKDIKYDGASNEVVGISVEFENNNSVVLCRVVSEYEIYNGMHIKREQFPIYLAYGLTVLETLGLTLHKADVDSSANVELYTALSRVRSLDELSLGNLDNYFSSSFDKIPAIMEYNRLRAMYRPDLPKFKIPARRHSNPKAFGNSDNKEDSSREISATLEDNTEESVMLSAKAEPVPWNH